MTIKDSANKFSIAAMIAVMSISTLLLIGSSIGGSFFGSPSEPEVQATVSNRILSPQEHVQSAEDYTLVTIGGTSVFLDKQTDIQIKNLHADDVRIQLIQGRVLIDGTLTAEVRDTAIHTTKQASLVHYSWLDEIDVFAIDGTIEITNPEGTRTLYKNGVHLKTREPYTVESITFNPLSSVAAPFYEWVNSQTTTENLEE